MEHNDTNDIKYSIHTGACSSIYLWSVQVFLIIGEEIFEGCSIFEVMNVLWDIPEIVKDDELFTKAAYIFTKRENKEMFVALQEPEIQVAWLKQNKV